MDGEDRDVFERSLRHAVEAHSGEPLDAALVDLGWPDALAEHTHEAVSILFELEGSAHASSSALDQVLACSLGLEAPLSAGFVLPPLGRRCPPGELDDGSLVVRGLGSTSLLARETAVVVAAGGEHRGRLPRAHTRLDPPVGRTAWTPSSGSSR